jgi:hypothetical protein
LAIALASSSSNLPTRDAESGARRIVQLAIFLGLCHSRGIVPTDTIRQFTEENGCCCRLRDWLRSGQHLIAPELWEVRSSDGSHRSIDDVKLLTSVDDALVGPVMVRILAQPLQGHPHEILGGIHERLAGLELAAAEQGRRKIQATAETRKKMGMFYTPEPIAQYIVAHALDGAETGDPPHRGGTRRILDPACGCGVFLSAAAVHLLKIGRTKGKATPPSSVVEQLCGIDVDPEAVLIARRSLWLELLTGLQGQIAVERDGHGSEEPWELGQRLGKMICCGDALLGPTLTNAGSSFDVVLGNPPYRRELGAKPLLDRLAASDLGRKYRTPRMDLWYYFAHRGLELLKPGGRLSFIVGAYWTAAPGAEKLVRQLRLSAQIEEIVCLDGGSVFEAVAGRQMILSLRKGTSDGPTTIRRVQIKTAGPVVDWVTMANASVVYEKTPQQLFRGGRIDLEPSADELLAKLAAYPPLGELGRIRQGIAENPASVTRKTNHQYGDRWKVGTGVFTLNALEAAALDLPEREKCLLRSYHDLCDLGRYWMAREPSLKLIYATAATCGEIDAFPAVRAHLEPFRPILEARRETRGGLRAWWQLHWPRDPGLWTAAKIIVLQMATRPAAVPALEPAYVPFSTNVFVPAGETREHLYYLTALLNSRVLWKWYRHHAKRRGVGLELNGHTLAQTPIRRIDFSLPSDCRTHDRLIRLVTWMLAINQRLRFLADNAQLQRLQRTLENVDRQIDAIVYRLYGLESGEIAEVEAQTGG